MRWLHLYVRSRQIPLALAVAAGMIALAWALARTFSEAPVINTRLTSVTVMVAVAALTSTLGGADDALDHTAAINWPVRRSWHLLLTTVAIVGLLLLTTATDARFAPLTLVLRNTAGLLGLTALGASLFGPGRAWIAPLTWTLIAISPAVNPSPELRTQIVGWLVQPVGTTAATVCAAVLAVTGLAGYALRGCPRNPAAETAPDQ